MVSTAYLCYIIYVIVTERSTGDGQVKWGTDSYNQATTKLAFHSKETSKDKLSII